MTVTLNPTCPLCGSASPAGRFSTCTYARITGLRNPPRSPATTNPSMTRTSAGTRGCGEGPSGTGPAVGRSIKVWVS